MDSISEKLKKYLPHLVAVLLFIALAALYFFPQFNGYDLRQGDINQFIGMSKEIVDFRATEKTDPLWTNSAFSGMPAYQISMESPNVVSWLESTLIFKLLRGPAGYIFVAMLGFYILLLCFDVNPWLSIIGAVAFGLSSVLFLYLAGGHNSKVHAIGTLAPVVGSVLYAYRKNFWIGGALAAVFICLQLSANHIQETYYLVFLIAGIVIYEGYRYIKENRIAKFLQVSLVLAIGAVVGVLPTVSNLLVTNEYGKYSTRGPSELTITPNKTETQEVKSGLEPWYIKQYSLSHAEVLSMVVPNIKGGASSYLGSKRENLEKVTPELRQYVEQYPSYWGEQYATGGAFYFGASVFLLFVLGMVFVRDSLKWALLAVSLLAIALSWKYSVVTDFFISNFPLFNKFRDTKMILVLVEMVFPFMGLWFLNEFLRNGVDKKKLLLTIGIVAGILLIFAITPKIWFSFFSRDEISQFDSQYNMYASRPDILQLLDNIKSEIVNVRISIMQKDFFRSILFILLTGGIVYLYAVKKLKKNYLIVLLTLVVIIDLWFVDKRYLNNESRAGRYLYWVDSYTKFNPFRASYADGFILNNEVNENQALQQKVTEAVNSVKPGSLKPAQQQNEREKAAFEALNANTDYRVFSFQDPFQNATTSYFHKSIGGYHGAKLKRYQELIDFRISREYQMLGKALGRHSSETISEFLKDSIPTLNMLNVKYIIYNPDTVALVNNFADGSVWFVKNVDMVNTADDEILALNTIDPKNTAVVNKEFSAQIKPIVPDSSASIKLESYKPNHLTYESNAKGDQVAVFSEIYYPAGWNAYIDSKPVPYFRTDYTLRGMMVPAGKHTIEFKFEPKTYVTGRKISRAGSLILILFVAGCLFLGFRTKNN